MNDYVLYFLGEDDFTHMRIILRAENEKKLMEEIQGKKLIQIGEVSILLGEIKEIQIIKFEDFINEDKRNS